MTLTSGKVKSKPESIKHDKEGLFLILKARVHNGEIMLMNILAPNVTRITLVKQKLQEMQGCVQWEDLHPILGKD